MIELQDRAVRGMKTDHSGDSNNDPGMGITKHKLEITQATRRKKLGVFILPTPPHPIPPFMRFQQCLYSSRNW